MINFIKVDSYYSNLILNIVANYYEIKMAVITLNLHILYILGLSPEYLLWGPGERSGEVNVYLQNVMVFTFLSNLVCFQLRSDSPFPLK